MTSGKYPCDKGVGSNLIMCKGCEKWVHRKCSGIKGTLITASGSLFVSLVKPLLLLVWQANWIWGMVVRLRWWKSSVILEIWRVRAGPLS